MSLFLLLIGCCIGLSAIRCSSADNPLIITVTPDGTDTPLCLRGDESCNSFDYAMTTVTNEDLEKPIKEAIIVVTYSQKVANTYIDLNRMILNLTIVGQGDVVFTCITSKDNILKYVELTITGSDSVRIHMKGIQIEKCLWEEETVYSVDQRMAIRWFDEVKLEDCIV